METMDKSFLRHDNKSQNGESYEKQPLKTHFLLCFYSAYQDKLTSILIPCQENCIDDENHTLKIICVVCAFICFGFIEFKLRKSRIQYEIVSN